MKIEFCGLSAEFTRQGLWLPCDADQPPEEQWGVYANKSNLVNALSRRALARSTVPRTIKLKHRSWQRAYSHPVYYLESFVDTERFAGTCYKAANWKCLGQTTGRGIKDKKKIVTLSLKDVLGYPLCKDFREKLCGDPVP